MARLRKEIKEISFSHEKQSQPKNFPFRFEDANQRMERASKIKVPNMLFSEFIFESDLSVLFASAGVGKTILGIQIADAISRGESIAGFKNQAPPQKVLYLDLELSAKQFESRYAEKVIVNDRPELRNSYKFHQNLKIASFQPYEIPKGDDAVDYLISSIKEMAEQHEIKIVFVDNITWLASKGLEQSKDAGKLMKSLDTLKKENELTLIVLAHTPKKNKCESVELRDLAGSAMVGNFIDSAFTINWSTYDSKCRYLKQVKCRFTEMVYDSHNVIAVQITNVKHNFVGIEQIFDIEPDFFKEDFHLSKKVDADTKIVTPEQKENVKDEMKEIMNDNPSISNRELAHRTGVSHPTIAKYKTELFNNNGQ